jgi:hypothetical protein
MALAYPEQRPSMIGDRQLPGDPWHEGTMPSGPPVVAGAAGAVPFCMTNDAEHYKRRVAESMAERRWILCADVAAALTPTVELLHEQGAPRPLVLAGSKGTGPTPSADDAEVVLLGTEGDTTMDSIRRYHAALRNLPGWVIDRIEAWDPDREALVLPTFLDVEIDIAGRRSWAGRRDEWLALEDKTVVDDLWRSAPIDHAPCVVVESEEAALLEAARRIDEGSGTVWAGDNREGWHGGADYTRFVADAERAGPTVSFMGDHAHRVRVMPFLEGVPCSIHAMVFPDDIAVFRPVEMVVFRVPDSDRFRYAGVATAWDPPTWIRDQMREAGRRVGIHVRDLVGFRGALTIDGVATRDGFLPTELNPRFGAGIGALGRAADMPLLGISRLLIAGADDLAAQDIEQITVEAADRQRHLGGFAVTRARIDEEREQRVDVEAGMVAAVDDGGNGNLVAGPSPVGGMVRLTLDPSSVRPSVFAAPIVASALATADRLWDTAIGPLIPATPAH